MQKRRIKIFLFLIFLVNAGLLSAQDTTGKAISEIEFAQRMQKNKTVVLDVRTPDEYKEGHLKNATNYNVLDSLAFEKQIATLPKNKKYLLYCRGGVRSGKALVLMQQKGFKHLYHLSGGISGWTGEIEKPKEQ
jgi:rhodanese-related sulfurtransferase